MIVVVNVNPDGDVVTPDDGDVPVPAKHRINNMVYLSDV